MATPNETPAPPSGPSTHEPFNRDIIDTGGYRYTDRTLLSATLANQRFTNEILAVLDAQSKSIVDIGCGDGTYTVELLERSGAARVLGIDPAAQAIERAQRLYSSVAPERLNFKAARSADLETSRREFDYAILRGVIHHTDNPRQEIADALRIAHCIIILEPNGLNPVLKILERVSPYHRAHAERSYSLRLLERWIESAGGVVLSRTFFGLVPMFCPPWLARLGRLLEPIVEKLPALRALLCGQVLITATSGQELKR